MKLNEINELKTLTLKDIENESLKQRLSSFGFVEGAKIEIKSRTKGMFLIKVLNSTYAINDALAEKFWVE